MRKLLGKSSSGLSLIAFAGVILLLLLFSRPVHSPELTRSKPQRPSSTAQPKLQTPPISEAGEAKQATGSSQSAVTAATPPSSSPTTPPSAPDEWTTDEIKEALKECIRLVAPIHAEIEPEQPMKLGLCGLPAPVQLRALGDGPTRVEFHPPVTMSCRLVVGLYRWTETVVQPAAREMLGSPITRVSGGTYACRHMYHNAHLPLSEHAKANAIDITRFTTADGRMLSVKQDWGPTERDLADARTRAAAALAKMQRVSESSPSDAAKKTSQLIERGRLLKAVVRSEEVLRKSEAASGRTEAAFLRHLLRGACGALATVLGPEANEAHRDHSHSDMKERDNLICH